MLRRTLPSWSPAATRSALVVRATVAALLVVVPLGISSPARAQEPGEADIRDVFATWEEWQRAYDDLVATMDAFEALSETPVESAEELLAVMKGRERVFRFARDVEGYLYLRLQLNSTDEEARSRQYLIDETDRKWYSSGSPWLTDTLTELGPKTIDGWMASSEALRHYDVYFRRFFRSSEHPFPEAQTELRTLANISGQQSDRVYKALAIAEAPKVEVTLQSGESLELSPARARTILEELPNALDRDLVSRAWIEALGRQSQTYAALLEGIVKRQRLLAEVRGFESALSAQLQSDAIPDDAIRNVVRVAREGSAPLRRYHSLRQRVLGLDEYGLEDRFVPLDLGSRRIGYAEARTLIVESTSTLGPEVQELVERAFSEGWIDAVERPGKRAHGGATFVPAGQHPYVLVNYRGALDTVFQLAHEIGHAAHALLSHETQAFIYAHPSSLTGETVAGIFEGVLVDLMIRQADSREEKIRVLDLAIQNLARLFYRPMLDADFELRIYETDGAITGPSLDALYLEVLADFYGNTLKVDDSVAHAWQMTPHYYTSPLYMGRYGLASAAGNVLLARITSPVESEAAPAGQALLELLRSGSTDDPIELLAHAGIDLQDPETIQAPVWRFESLVVQLERSLNSSR